MIVRVVLISPVILITNLFCTQQHGNAIAVHGISRRVDMVQEFTRAAMVMKAGKISPHSLVEYLEDANSLLFDTDVKGAELYRSDDGGVTWNKTHDGYLDDMFYTYGYYFSQVRTVKNEPSKVYMIGFVDLM